MSSHYVKSRLIKAVPIFAKNWGITEEAVADVHLPGLRALIKKQFPELKAQQQTRILEAARPYVGGWFSGGKTDAIKGLLNDIGLTDGYPGQATTQTEYSNAINGLARNADVKSWLEAFKNEASFNTPEGSPGYGSWPQTEKGDVAGKQTLSAHYVIPGTDMLDTTIPKKVESEVQADFFSYWSTNTDAGIYNALYLQDKQWEKEVRFGGDLAEPRSGYDQQYFPAMDLLPQRENQQPVYMELLDKFETDFYAIAASHDKSWDPLKDLAPTHDPIMNRTYMSHFKCANSLEGDGKWPYADPDDPHSSAYVNEMGFKPMNDAWQFPDKPSRWLPVTKQFTEAEQLKKTQQMGFDSWQLPKSFDSFPERR